MNVLENPSWFRDYPHRWIMASLPLAYAMACVEVVSKNSEKAGKVYWQIIEAWRKPGAKAISEEILHEVPYSEKEKVKQALLHPESGFLPDPNKPFKDLEEIFADLKINEDFLKVDDNTEKLSLDDQQDVEEVTTFVGLILEFIAIGFNRESDIEKCRYRVIPSEKAPWLIWAVMIRSSFESHNITLERLRHIYKLRKYKGKVIDFHEVLTEQPMSRWCRRIIASGKEAKILNVKS